MDVIEIKYSSWSLGGGYVTEVVQCQGTQQAINLVHARVPDARIDSIVIRPEAQPGNNTDRR
jgi:hypothetical protein